MENWDNKIFFVIKNEYASNYSLFEYVDVIKKVKELMEVFDDLFEFKKKSNYEFFGWSSRLIYNKSSSALFLYNFIIRYNNQKERLFGKKSRFLYLKIYKGNIKIAYLLDGGFKELASMKPVIVDVILDVFKFINDIEEIINLKKILTPEIYGSNLND